MVNADGVFVAPPGDVSLPGVFVPLARKWAKLFVNFTASGVNEPVVQGL